MLPEISIEYIKGVGPKKGEILSKELQIDTLYDLITYFPYRYVDKSKFYAIKDLFDSVNTYVQVKGKITDIYIVGEKKAKRLIATIEDASGSLDLVWFNSIPYIQKSIEKGKEYIVFGRPTLFGTTLNVTHPEISLLEEQSSQIKIPFQPLYGSTERMKKNGLDSRGVSKIIRQALQDYVMKVEENLPVSVVSKLGFIDRKSAFWEIHFPTSQAMLEKAQNRLKFEEMFFMQLSLLRSKLVLASKNKGFFFPKVGAYFNEFYFQHLPFELTDAQKKVIKEIRADLISGKQMNRLLQGDVGSGKTITALLIMLLVVDNAYQACLMAPTEILATQHYENISYLLRNMNVEVALLTGNMKASERKKLLENLKEGKISILIGTHALIEKDVDFQKLGLVVIDEQHRFGVEQRAKLWKKNASPPHILVMTATPIPRTLAMTVYGDLDLSVIDQLPQGRKSIVTYHFHQSNRGKVFSFIRKEIQAGRQIYVVFPLIKESEAMDLRNLMEGYEAFSIDFPEPHYKIGVLHGKMKTAEKDEAMQKFVSGETHILLATTVIEVGINVPNATVMLIENSERYGLSQLHQLRGRVGRGADQSYCIMLTGDKLSNDSRRRIKAMLETNDGFEIAEFDLRLRGPGDIVGTRQSGMLDFKLINIIKDEKLIDYCRKMAVDFLQDDPNLKKEENKCVRAYLEFLYKRGGNYSQIS